MPIPQRPKILIAEDMGTIRHLITKYLEQLGYTYIITVDDGQKALDALNNGLQHDSPFDLLLTDINMPNKTGIELLQGLRQVDELRDLPVIMITTEAERPFIIKALEYGVNAYIVKPFTKETLREKILSVLP